MKKIAAIVGMGLMSLSVAFAQQDSTLNRTVVVENEYNPTVMDASKINVMPKMNEPKATKKNINYATSLREVSAWDYETMSPVVREWESDAAYRGYLRGGYGNNGNVDVRAGYLWDISKKDRLKVSASLDGWNTDLRGWKEDASDFTDKEFGSRMYNTKVALDYRHSFGKVDFMLGGNYHSQVFNYLVIEDYPEDAWDTDKNQHRNLANGYLNFASTDKDMPIQFAAELGLNYLGMTHTTEYLAKESETNLYAKGNVWKTLNDENLFGLGVRFDNYAYTSEHSTDVTALDFNPYYTLQNDRWNVRIGAHVDWWGGEKDKMYISPDVNVEHRFAGSYVLYAKAGGGREVSGLYELTKITPYWIDELLAAPTYLTLDAALGLKGSPLDGLWFHVSGGYQIRENDVCLSISNSSELYYARNWGGDTKVLYGSAGLRYDYKDVFDFSLEGTYYNWEYESLVWEGVSIDGLSKTAMSLKPELEIVAEAGAKVMDGLRAHVGYEYVKRSGGIYDPVNNLYAGVDYSLLKNLNVFGKINNLMNANYVRPDACPAQGFNFLAGLSLQF